MRKPYLRLIGDVHGRRDSYLRKASEAEYSLQVGDMGFDYHHMAELAFGRHFFIGGNHDNYTLSPEGSDKKFSEMPQNFLADYGTLRIPGVDDIFYLRGSRSIDKEYRTPGQDWWPDEELSEKDLQEARSFYKYTRPEIVVTHDCPAGVIANVARYSSYNNNYLFPSTTSLYLQLMHNEWQPSVWIFGHYHKSTDIQMNKTRFICLAELETLDLQRKEKSGHDR